MGGVVIRTGGCGTAGTLRVTTPLCISLVDPRSNGHNPWARMERDETIPSLAINNRGNASRGRGVVYPSGEIP
jgi:hypothetical protein